MANYNSKLFFSVEMADVAYQKFACMDDRIAEPSLLTPGGDLGEFLLGLSILVNGNSQQPLVIDAAGITDIMSRYVQNLPPNRRFYHCNDDSSVTHLEKDLSVVGLDLVSNLKLTVGCICGFVILILYGF